MLWEVTVSVIMRKKARMTLCRILIGYLDRAV